MRILTFVLVGYTTAMLGIHLSSWKLLRQWTESEDSWVKRRFSARVALRVEGIYWLLILVYWPFWPSAGWSAVVAVFAAIHFGVWLAAELRAARSGTALSPSRRSHRFIVAFDLVEAGVLVAIAWLTALRTLGAG